MATSERQSREARPIFVVGSPRSGTSVLTWVLGQHPNILPVEEAPGRGPFAVAIGVHYAVGSQRGARSHLTALGVDRDVFSREFGDAIDRLVLNHRHELERRNAAVALEDPAQSSEYFAISRSADEPKRRWVDGTPESSFYICGLNRLFPDAKFVHILRDVRESAVSMLGFHKDDGSALVQNLEEACVYWLRATQACDLARRALGAEKVYKLHYEDLVASPERALRGVFDFLGEEFAPACLEPLAERINSSRVENVDLSAAAKKEPKIAATLAYSDRLCSDDAPVTMSTEAQAEFEAQFDAMIEHARNIDGYHEAARATLERIDAALGLGGDIADYPHILQERDAALRQLLLRSRRAVVVCGVLLLALWLTSLATWLKPNRIVAACTFAVATLSLLIYAWLRRAGLRAALKRRSAQDTNKERR